MKGFDVLASVYAPAGIICEYLGIISMMVSQPSYLPSYYQSLFDTPGIHVHHRMAAVVSPSDLTLLAPRRRLQGHLIAPSIFRRGQKLFPMEIDDLPLKSMDEMDLMDNVSSKEIKFSPQLSSTEEEDETSLSGTSVLWGGIIRLDIIKVINIFMTIFC